MARILNTRVIYGVRQGFFNGKEPEFSPDLQPPFFTLSDYEENRILLLVDPKTQPQVTARIYRIPVAKPKKKQKSFDLIAINDINSEKYVWQGSYRPVYPEPWATQQKNLGNKPKPTVESATYLGWNGQWTLNYSTPIFTWIHKLKNHGWIYD